MILSKLFHKKPTTAFSGVTLLEMCIGMMILSVLCVGAASMVRAGVESQLEDRMQVTMQTVAANIAGDLRFDLARADSTSVGGTGVQVMGGGTGLWIDDGSGTFPVRYALSATGDLTRTANGNVKFYNRVSAATPYQPALTIDCNVAGAPANYNVPCFAGSLMMNMGTPAAPNFQSQVAMVNPTQIRINNMRVLAPTLNTGTYVAMFGVPQFRLQTTSFNVLSSMEFQ